MPILALPAVLAALALGACGDSHTKVTTGTYAGESGANAPYLDVGPLKYQVQLSRQLNPANSEDSGYLAGPRAGRSQARSGPGVVRGVHAGLQQHRPPPAGGGNDDHQRHPGQCLRADRAERDEPLRLPGRRRARQRAAPACRHDAGLRAHAGLAAALQDRSSRSTTARSRSRSRIPKTSPNRPGPSSTSSFAPAGEAPAG